MRLLKQAGGPIQVEEQQCRLLSDEERASFQEVHLDCSNVCRGRCGFANGMSRLIANMNQGTGDIDCLCTFECASR